MARDRHPARRTGVAEPVVVAPPDAAQAARLQRRLLRAIRLLERNGYEVRRTGADA